MLASLASVNSLWQEIILNLVVCVQTGRKQRQQRQQRFFVEIGFVGDCHGCAIRQQHPNWDLQPLAALISDADRTVSAFRSANNLKSHAVERMERIENLDVCCFCAQGILRAGVFIRICIVSCPAVARHRTANDGSAAGRASFCRCEFCPVCSGDCSSLHCNGPSTPAS
jgi:hypothetical protein